MRLVLPRLGDQSLPFEVGRPISDYWEKPQATSVEEQLDPISDELLAAHGGSIYRPRNPGCDFIAFQNARGIDRFPRPAEEAINVMDDLDLSFFGIAEPNCAFGDDISTAIDASLKQRFGCGFAKGSSSSRSHSGYLAGGAVGMIRGNMVGRHNKSGVDPEGRYSWMILSGRNDRKLCIITAYRVTQEKGSSSQSKNPNTAYWQQVRAGINRGITDPDPRAQVLKDLTTFITARRADGCDVILMMDANVKIMDSSSKWNTFLANNLLHDVHKAILPTVPASTRQGSTRRLDYITATETALSFVRDCGYLALHDGIVSDHTLLWMEFDTKRYFGGEGPSLTPPQAREFSVDNVEMREKFLSELRKIHEHQRLPQRIAQLEREFQRLGPSRARAARYNALDRELVDSIKAAAKRTVKRKQHGYARSPALTAAGAQVLFWKSILSSKRHGIELADKAYRIGEREGLDVGAAERATTLEAHQQLNLAWNQLKATQREAVELRIAWLEGIARVKAASEGNDDSVKTLKLMIRNLHEKRMYQKLSRIKQGARSGLDWIEVPTGEWYFSRQTNELYHYDKGVFEAHPAHKEVRRWFLPHHTLKVIPEDAMEVVVEPIHVDSKFVGFGMGDFIKPMEWRRVTEKHEIESHLLERNKRHLQQMAMEKTPPSQENFKRILENYGTSPLADLILSGEVTDELDQFPPVLRTWLKQFRTNEAPECKPVDGFIYRKQFQAAFRSVKEKTSSSPSGIHYTFWKCMAMDDDISDYLVVMMRLPFIYGFRNERWAKCLDVMLEKKKGVRKIHQLRIIGLLEADFNTALKFYFAKQMVFNAEHGDLTEEQWGGRPGRTAHEPALRKALAFDYGRLLFITIAIFANDAVANFDRMVPDLSAVVVRQHHVEPSVMISRNSTLEAMEHQVRTAHGDSARTYKWLPGDVQLGGETQGKADVPSIWSVTSQTVLKAHQVLHEGICLPSADRKRKIAKNNDAFVDDTDGVASKRRKTFHESERATRKHLQAGAQIWQVLIEGTGGAIAFHKSAWQMLAFDGSTFPPTIKHKPAGTIYLYDSHGYRSKIKKMSSSEPNKGLGVRLAADGNMEAEYEHRVEQCRELTARAGGARMSLNESYKMLLTYMVPSISYPLAITTFTETQCHDFNVIVDRTMLPKLGLNRHMPKGALYAPLCLGGVNYPSFQVAQDQAGILLLLKSLRWNQTMANDILVLLSINQLLSGLTEPIFEDTATDLSYVANGWIMHQRRRLHALNASMWVEHQWTPALQRVGDASLMKAFSQVDSSTPKKLAMANWCRLYLRVITIAEVANAKGDAIPGNRLNGQWRATSSLEFPDIDKPPDSYWRVFRWYVRKAFATRHPPSTRLSRPVRLDVPLRAWLPVTRHVQYDFYRSALHSFNRNGKNFLHYSNTEHTPSSAFSCPNIFWADGTADEIPSDAHPVDGAFDVDSMWVRQRYNMQQLPSAPVEKFTRAISSHNRSNRGGSDGSVERLDGSRASAYAIHHEGTKFEGATNCPRSQYSTSYRAELEGQYGLTKLAIENEIPIVASTCDNKAAVASITTPIFSAKQMLDPEIDIIMATQKLQREAATEFTLKWVKAHQSDGTPFADLDDDAQLNEEMDAAAKHSRTHDTPAQQQPLPGSGAMLKIDGQWVTTKYKEQIHLASARPRHIAFFLNKYKDKTIDDYNSIDWPSIGEARTQLTQSANIRVAKYMNGWLNSGRQKGLFGKDPTCPCCGWHEETQLHMFQCPHAEMKDSRASAFELIRKYLKTKKVHPFVAGPFATICRAACDSPAHEPLSTPDGSTPLVRRAIEAQCALGRDFLLRGYLVPEWKDALAACDAKRTLNSFRHLHLCLWTILLETIWERRNRVLHGPESITDKYERQKLLTELQEWRRQSAHRLGAAQQYLAEYSDRALDTWTTAEMRATIALLTKAAQNHHRDLTIHKQRRITDFFVHARAASQVYH